MEIRQSSLESLGMKKNFWSDRKVFLTGHTGFKGGWIALWLTNLGAKVYGYSLSVPTFPSFFSETKLEHLIEYSFIGDIRDLETLTKSMQSSKPSIIIHMAAQSLVRNSYQNPVDTFSTNLIGTVNLLESVRQTSTVEAVVNITTDKCYENKEWVWSYREKDQLGGHDPYSSSKACAEIATAAYRKSFLADAGINLASVRAGNVIGGGDWADDRLIPDFLRAIEADKTLLVRSPHAIRPWQHVLEPLSGYLLLAENLVNGGFEFAEAWNFGPDDSDAKPVSWIVDHLCQKFNGLRWKTMNETRKYESSLLKLDSSKAKMKLNWSPRWTLDTALDKTIEWYLAWKEGQSMKEISLKQIELYEVS